MNCKNCGAPMKIVENRDYFFCQYCSTIDFPEESLDGVRALEEVTDLDCPICQSRMVTATIQDLLKVSHCPKCKGILLDQGAFFSVYQYLRPPNPGPNTPRPLNPEDLKRQILCPKCRHMMDTHPYYGPGNIVVDNCNQCRMLWLDYGELYRVSNALWHERMEESDKSDS